MTTRKIYIDSRQAQGTGSDFTLTLKQSVQVPENTIAYIDDIIIPNTFLKIDANRCWVYISETFGTMTLSHRTQIAHGNNSGIDLAAALQFSWVPPPFARSAGEVEATRANEPEAQRVGDGGGAGNTGRGGHL